MLFTDLVLPEVNLSAHVSHDIRGHLFRMGGRRVPHHPLFRIGLRWRDAATIFLEILALHRRILERVRVRLWLVILLLLQQVSGHRHRICLASVLDLKVIAIHTFGYDPAHTYLYATISNRLVGMTPIMIIDISLFPLVYSGLARLQGRGMT